MHLKWPNRGQARLGLSFVWPSQAFAQDTLVDPGASGALAPAVHWLQGTLLGTVATVIAVIAVASIGFAMLTGRTNWRHGATVIFGCFILFGAPSIAAGIMRAAQGSSGQIARSAIEDPSPLPAAIAAARKSSTDDPYAGASLLRR